MLLVCSLMIYAHYNLHLCPKHCWTWKYPKWPDKNNSLSTWNNKFHNVKFFFPVMFWIIIVVWRGRRELNEVSDWDWGGECLGCPEFGAQLSLTKGDAREAATSQRIRSAAAGQLPPNSSPSEQLSWEFAQEKNPNWRSRHGCSDRLKRVQVRDVRV